MRTLNLKIPDREKGETDPFMRVPSKGYLAEQRLIRHTILPLCGVMILGFFGSACSSTEKSFTTPKSLCGTPISPKLLTPLLGPGKKLSMTSTNDTKGFKTCRINVDGKAALSISSQWENKEKSLRDVAAYAYNNVDPGDQVSGDGMYIYSDTGAIGHVVCTEPPTASERVFAFIRVSDAGKPDESALAKLIRTYSESIKDSEHCKNEKDWVPEPDRTWQ
ncbi:hypothetical protein [Streptomyces sp. NPDC059452]|uniref:hypothetical protein n=1 Tax=Streptomyces sp. NPDC059452 TaxID=3346835 RepID=UPI0036750A81